MAELKKFEYIIEFEPNCLSKGNGEYCFMSKSVKKLVRCRNCIHAEMDGADGEQAIYCRMWDRWEMPPDGYCHFGKER